MDEKRRGQHRFTRRTEVQRYEGRNRLKQVEYHVGAVLRPAPTKTLGVSAAAWGRWIMLPPEPIRTVSGPPFDMHTCAILS